MKRVRVSLRIIEETGKMEAHRRLLELAARGQLPECIDEQSTPEFNIYRELIEAKYLKAINVSSHPPAGGRAYLNPRITMRGREHLNRLMSSAITEGGNTRHLELRETTMAESVAMHGRRVFIGHGRSPLWRELKDFIAERLRLPWEEFNREPAAGVSTVERLQQMLDASGFALLVMTAEDEHTDQTRHARENVIHEVGLFQGKLSFRKAIVLVEEGCVEFSNIIGLNQIRFPRGRITACFEDVRGVLEREGIIAS
jgi:Predicted nucleotide-binding protein containing TIR-like domain